MSTIQKNMHETLKLMKLFTPVYCYLATELHGVTSQKAVISRVQNIFLLKPGFRLIKIYYDNHGT
jgi:hypothetical protein